LGGFLAQETRNVPVNCALNCGLRNGAATRQQQSCLQHNRRITIESLPALPAEAYFVDLGTTVLASGSGSSFDQNCEEYLKRTAAPARAKDWWARFTWVSPGHFALLDIPVLAGRDFNETDTEDSPKVAIVNQTFVHRFFGNANPVGRTFHSVTEPNYPMEYAKDNIRVNAVAPGAVYTPLHRETPKAVMESLSPMGRPSTVEDITDAVMYLTDAVTVTGHILYVDGGSHFGRW
jgi:hypothetical protein